MKFSSRIILPLFLLLVLLFVRIYFLLESCLQFHNFEGLYRGFMAKELLDGSGFWSIFNNPYFPAEGGSVVTGYLAVVSFAIFGDSFFALILVPILFSLLMFAVFYLFLEKYFNRYTAIIFSFFFIFPPPQFFRFSLYAMGFHCEAALFSILGLFCFFEIFFNEVNYKAYSEKTHSRNLNLLFLVFGLISGFGTYFLYDYLIILLTIFLFWLFFDFRLFLRKYFYIFFLGFAFGFLPWIIYNATHRYQGSWNIRSSTLLEIIASKNVSQIFQSFWFIIAKQQPVYLEKELFFIIASLFLLVAFSVFKSIGNLASLQYQRHSSINKEFFFISYILIFVSAWSTLYLPVRNEELPLWLSGLTGRFFGLYPFLFVLIAIGINKFKPRRKDKRLFPNLIITVFFMLWFLRIGLFNLTCLISPESRKIDPRTIKGYSVRLSYRTDIKRQLTFLDSDINRILYASNYDSKLLFWANTTQMYRDSLFYTDSRLLAELKNNKQIEDHKKPCYYLLLGLNTGDCLADYNISEINGLVIKRIPERYKQFFYEGVALSLMNRSSKELLQRVDFIKCVPSEYRHYFLLELGRIIGIKGHDKVKIERLSHSVNKFSPLEVDYLYGSIVKTIVADVVLKNASSLPRDRPISILQSQVSLALRIFRQDHHFSVWYKKNSIEDKLGKYIDYELIGEWFRYVGLLDSERIKSKIKKATANNSIDKRTLYEGVGLSLGRLTFGNRELFSSLISTSIEASFMPYVYKGFEMSLMERYGKL